MVHRGGHVSKRSTERSGGRWHFTLGAHETSYHEELSSAFKRVFATELSVHSNSSDHSVRMVSNSSKVVAELLLSLAVPGTAQSDWLTAFSPRMNSSSVGS